MIIDDMVNDHTRTGFKKNHPMFKLSMFVILQAIIDQRDPEKSVMAAKYFCSDLFEMDCRIIGLGPKDLISSINQMSDKQVEQLKGSDFILLF